MGNRQGIPVFLEVIAQIAAGSIFREHLEPKVAGVEAANPRLRYDVGYHY